MSRDEVVLLVSRALAVMYAVSALLGVTEVPEYLFSAHHYTLPGGLFTFGESYLETIHRLEVASLLIRIVGHSVVSWLFWRCGPWVAGLLLPVRKTEPAAEE
jgi:hypothetical protein